MYVVRSCNYLCVYFSVFDMHACMYVFMCLVIYVIGCVRIFACICLCMHVGMHVFNYFIFDMVMY